MQRIFRMATGLLVSLLSVSFSVPVHSQPEEIVIGLIPEMNVFRQKERFAPLGQYLSEKTGKKIKLKILGRYGNILESFDKADMSGAFFGSFTGALAIQRLDIEFLARPVNLDGESTYHGHVFVRKDSGIRNVADMKGKRFAFVEKATTAGYVFPLAYFHQHGVKNVERYLGEPSFTGSHDASLFSVLDGKADIGAAKNTIFDRVAMENPRIAKEIVVLAESEKVPSNGLGVRKSLDNNLKASLKAALLGLDKTTEGKAVLEKFGALRFIETRAEEYQPVFDMAKKAGIDVKKYEYRNE